MPEDVLLSFFIIWKGLEDVWMSLTGSKDLWMSWNQLECVWVAWNEDLGLNIILGLRMKKMKVEWVFRD